MGLFSWGKKKSPGGKVDLSRTQLKQTGKECEYFSHEHPGCEIYFEEATPRNNASIVLVAPSGQWKRWAVGDIAVAQKISHSLHVPMYEVKKTGYPSAMRRWSENHR